MQEETLNEGQGSTEFSQEPVGSCECSAPS